MNNTVVIWKSELFISAVPSGLYVAVKAAPKPRPQTQPRPVATARR